MSRSHAALKLGLLAPPILAGLAAQASAHALDADWVRLAIQSFALVCVVISTATVAGAFARERSVLLQRGSARSEALKAVSTAPRAGSLIPRQRIGAPETGATARRSPVRTLADRRLPTVERSSGLLVQWYFILRIEEEINRAKRYGQKFTVITIETPNEKARGEAIEYVTRTLRKTDLAGEMGTQIGLLLIQTDGVGADVVLERLQNVLPSAAFQVSSYPKDGTSASELLGEGRWWQSDADPEAHLFAA